MPNLLEDHAREKAKGLPGWRMLYARRCPPPPDATLVYEVVGVTDDRARKLGVASRYEDGEQLLALIDLYMASPRRRKIEICAKRFRVTPAQVLRMVDRARTYGLTNEPPDRRGKRVDTIDPVQVDRVWITLEEHYAWLAAWEERTGRCGACAGVGLVIVEQPGGGEGAKAGNKLCVRCNGDGMRPGSVDDAQAERRRA